MLRTENLSFSYNETTSFSFPKIECSKRDTLLITGNSGVGKTTLLHILSGILRPSTGKVYVGENDLYGMSDGKRDKFRGNNIGIIFQTPHFVSSLSTLDNLSFASFLSGKKRRLDEARLLLRKLNIESSKDKRPWMLSTGQKQRLGIARALINMPKVILADEPTSSLDDMNCEAVAKLLQDFTMDYNTSLVIVTHDNRLKELFNNQISLS